MSRCYKYRQGEEHSDINRLTIIEEYTEQQLSNEIVMPDKMLYFNVKTLQSM